MMNKDEIDKLLNDVDKNITELTRRSYEQMLEMIRDGVAPRDAREQIREALETINEEAAGVIAASLNSFIAGTVTTEYVKNFEVHGTKLSRRLYNNAKGVELETMRVINDAIKQNKTIAEVSRLLYDGYDFKEDPLRVKQKGTLPKWLKKELSKPPSKRSFKQVGTIKTKALKAAYTQALKSQSDKELAKEMRRAFYEKSRYYANRIAQNEVMKSYSIERAKMLAEDDGFEVVKVRMSRTHERVDICDYHSKVDKFGLGAGVYPKQKAPVPPFHPFCRCIIVPLASKSAADAKFNKKADREVMDKFNSYEKSLIVGSKRRRDVFMKNGDVLKSAYIGKPLYIDEVRGVKYIGYNSDMKTFSINSITDEELNAIQMWTDDSSDIKSSMWGINDSQYYNIVANRIFSLFDKYKTNIKDNTPIYRGMAVSEKIFNLYGYDKIKAGDLYSPDKNAVTSFSKNKRVAYEFASEEAGEYKIVIKAYTGNENALDISKMSSIEEEEETIITKNIWYNVKNVKRIGKWILILLDKTK